MARRRPLAGERGRSRLGSSAAPETPAEETNAGGAADLEPPAAQVDPDPAAPPSGTQDVSSPARGRPRVSRADLPLVVGLVLVLALAGVAAAVALFARAAERVENARTQARTAAEQAAVALLSYDHRHLDRDFRAARRLLTGGFAKDYADTTERVVRPTAEQVKAVVTAEVAASSVVRSEQNRVVVLLFVDQTTTSTRVEGPKVDLNRVRMTLERTGGRWLVSGVDAL